jgi:calcyclin binding protein
LDQDAVKTNFTDESLEVRIENYKNKNVVFNIYKTCHKINPEKSYHKIKSDYLLVFICKHNPGSNWSHFTYADRMKSDSNKLKSDGKVNDKAGDDPSAGLMDMMKKLYDDGDEEMKRTIAKAWTEGQQKKADF